MKKDIVIIGGSGCAKEVLFLLEENNKICDEWMIKGFIDNQEGKICGLPILGNDEWLMSRCETVYAVCGVGEPEVKKKIINKYKSSPNIIFPTIISKNAMVGEGNTIGRGCIICAGAVITKDVILNDFVLINIGSTICHESYLDSFVSVGPGVNISGNVRVGQSAHIGVGAKIIQNIEIGAGAVIGAGSTVIRKVEKKTTVAGNPAHILK